MRKPVIVDVVRTPVGKFGGSLSSFSAADLGSFVFSSLVKRNGLDPEKIDQIVMGCVLQAGANAYAARVALLQAGLPVHIPALAVNRVCGSALEAVNQAARLILTGEAKICIAGGMESMSNAPYLMPSARWGARMGDAAMVDGMVTAVTDPWLGYHMGRTAENLAGKYGITRAEQDAFALRSQHLAAKAVDEGRFAEQIVPVEIKTRKETVSFDRDEGVRPDATLESLSRLKPAFLENGTVTAGNASTINDAACALLIMEEDAATAMGYEPLASIVSWAVVGVEPEFMGIGPAKAVPEALKKAGIALRDVAVHELNEAFAAQALACLKELGLSPDDVNPNGGAIALGHPIGASGAILAGRVVHELIRADREWGVASLCIGGGQGIATVFRNERK